ncbi:hypothetical protein M9H77_31944 [Catharanthus roseus]|uniref:Uncharacterized protein n=1 Tax=Catharanthus roseus TaxID=4058 RepID=A0ACC0A2S9_CATRO|nr:hypothetical protein M9H77_31944 [Catharanthus roseus]
MATRVIQAPLSSLTHIASFAKKVQIIIQRCMVSIDGTLGCTPSQHDIQQTFPMHLPRRCPQEPVPDRGARGVKNGTRRLPGGMARGSRTPVPPDMGIGGHVDPERRGERGEGSRGRGCGDLGSSIMFGFDTTYPVPSRWIGHIIRTSLSGFRVFFISVTSLFGCRVLFISGTTSSKHWEFFISGTSSFGHASSSDTDEHDDERTDEVTPAQQLGFGYRVGKKTTKFTPSDWP